VWWLEKPGVVLVMRGGYDRAANRACTKAEWFLKEGRCWKRRQEHIDQVCWSAREIRRTLREAGFDRIRTWDATLFFKDDPFIVPRARTYYRARKRA
jgi:hypothetical protein